MEYWGNQKTGVLLKSFFLILIFAVFLTSSVNYSHFTQVNLTDTLIKVIFVFSIIVCSFVRCPQFSQNERIFIKTFVYSLGLIMVVASIHDWKILFSFRTEMYWHALLLLALFKLFTVFEFNEKVFWQLISGFAAILFSIALYSYMNGNYRVSGVAANINAYGKLTAVVGILFLIRLLVHKYDGYVRLILDLTFLVMLLFALFVSETRAAWAGFFIVSVGLLFVLYKRMSFAKKTSVIVLFVCMVILLAIFGDVVFFRLQLGAEGVYKYFENNNLHSSVGYRLEMWKIVLTSFWKHPVLGFGLDSFNERIVYLRSISETMLPPIFGSPHNEYLYMLFSLGILGVLALLGLYVGLWMLLVKTVGGFKYISSSIYSIAFVAILVFIGVANLFDTSWSQKHVIYVYVLIMMMCFFLVQKEQKKREKI